MSLVQAISDYATELKVLLHVLSSDEEWNSERPNVDFVCEHVELSK
jgi:hypothetical protein